MRTLVALSLFLAACADSPTANDDAASDGNSPLRDLAGARDGASPPRDLAFADGATDPLIAARPYLSHVPASYDPSKPTPLVVMLHGYASDAAGHEKYFQFVPLSDAMGFLYAWPDGTKDNVGLRFWNATDACCNLFGSKVDDVAYLTAVVDDMASRYNVDAKRVFFVGHSNGAFMSHRMACDRASRVAAIVALDGDDWKDTTKCAPSEKVAVLQIHGDMDQTIQYGGGANFPQAAYPSATASVAGWAGLNGCGATPDGNLPPVDIDSAIAGAETKPSRYPCPNGGAAELWTVVGGPHQPPLATGANALMWGFLAAHPKP